MADRVVDKALKVIKPVVEELGYTLLKKECQDFEGIVLTFICPYATIF